MPEKIELGLFYAPAPMSEHFYSVIDDKTKMTPEAKANYTRSDIADTRIAELEAEVQRLRDNINVALDGLYFIAKNYPESPAQEIIFQIEQALGDSK
jgi:HAMP domain-containing protein